ncbi:dehydrase and lipid transport-domain-containing protein [Myxozyma melibiosi]|uniref:Dehydrase and lipid transport-domain-containing protein n=1 Tax=Myxozyma melibiosi TaxID=54550 RepID=A0ABR1F043_9ASCO
MTGPTSTIRRRAQSSLLTAFSVHRSPQCRSFFAFPGTDSQVQKVSLTRTLPYSPSLLYSVVSNVDDYSTFVPYCTSSKITQLDSASGQPSRAMLRVGWQTFEEEFESELTCDEPNSVIAESSKHSLFKILYTRWRIFPVAPTPTTSSTQSSPTSSTSQGRLVLDLKFQFESPLYNAVSAQFAPAVAQIMIEAFEKRMATVQRLKLLEENKPKQTGVADATSTTTSASAAVSGGGAGTSSS